MATTAKTVETKIIDSLQKLNMMEKRILWAVAETMIKENSEEPESRLTAPQKVELDIALVDHKDGKLKYYTVEQSKKIVYGKIRK